MVIGGYIELWVVICGYALLYRVMVVIGLYIYIGLCLVIEGYR